MRLGIGDDELAVWQDMSRRMFVPFLGDGIMSQFEGYEDLEELDWDAYRAKYGNIQRLDRILRGQYLLLCQHGHRRHQLRLLDFAG